jgi:hypothetical protein
MQVQHHRKKGRADVAWTRRMECKTKATTGVSKMVDGDDNNNDDDDDNGKEELVSDFGEDDLASSGVMMKDLDWRVEKMRLEEANIRRFLKAKPRFLPYEDCRKWVQAWGQRWLSAKEW